ncbi:MAG: radical SAM protein [Candidatus Hermodarchaeota archaeon]
MKNGLISMNNQKQLLEKLIYGKCSWLDYSNIIRLKPEDFDSFLEAAYKLKIKNFGFDIKVYIPNKKFPAISITGSECALQCEHCNKKYLSGMKGILSKEDLEKFLFNFSKSGGIGVLISGGCEPDGSVPLLEFLDTIKLIKDKTNLIINTHTGLLSEITAKKLAESNVDIISFDINMDKEVIRDIYHLNKNPEDYKKSVEYLKNSNLNIVPHICVGLFYGRLHKELEAIQFIKESGLNPSLIVLIALIPPKNLEGKFLNPNPIDIAKIITIIRFVFPNTEISLGCMRPRGKDKFRIEKYAILAGVNRIEIPSVQTLRWLKQRSPDIRYKFFSACCAIPEEFEIYAKSEKSDLKKYNEFISNYE